MPSQVSYSQPAVPPPFRPLSYTRLQNLQSVQGRETISALICACTRAWIQISWAIVSLGSVRSLSWALKTFDAAPINFKAELNRRPVWLCLERDEEHIQERKHSSWLLLGQVAPAEEKNAIDLKEKHGFRKKSILPSSLPPPPPPPKK